MEKKKMSFETYILAFSTWMLLITWEGSLSVQSVLPFLITLLAYTIVKKRIIIKLDVRNKLLFFFFLYICFSTAINALLHINLISNECLFGILYFFVIFLWFCLLTQNTYTKEEIQFVLKTYLILSTICTILIILNALNVAAGKISFHNFVGILIDENHVSALMSVPVIYLLLNLIIVKESLKKKISKLLLALFNIIGILLTGSRAAFLGLILVVVLAFLINLFSKITYKKVLTTMIAFLIFLVIAKVALSLIPAWTYNRFINGNYHDNSNSERISLWKNAIKGVSKSPIFGYGMGFFHNMEEYQYAVSFRKIPSSVPAHNTFLDLSIYSGVVGIIIFLSFLWNIFKIYLKKENRMGLTIVAYILFIAMIIGAEKTVFLWNNLIILTIIGNYILKNKCNFNAIFLKEG